MSDEMNPIEGAEDGLPEAQSRAIAALVNGDTMTKAAELAGVNRTTLYRWHDDKQFAAALARAKRERRTALRCELCSLASVAVRVLRDVMEKQLNTPVLRVKVAMDVLKAVGVDRPEETTGADCGEPLPTLPLDRPARDGEETTAAM